MRTVNRLGVVNVLGAQSQKSVIQLICLTLCVLGLLFFTSPCLAGEIVHSPRSSGSTQAMPECALDITCMDQAVRLGNLSGVCLRADCPGVFAVLHQRTDEVSFRRRFLSYRHFAFEGRYVLKDQGTMESGPVRSRELFFVLPGDVIEFRIDGSDCLAKIDLRNLGYVKKGPLCELQHWLAEKTFMEIPNGNQPGATEASTMEHQVRRPCQLPDSLSSYDGTTIFYGLVGALKRLNLNF